MSSHHQHVFGRWQETGEPGRTHVDMERCHARLDSDLISGSTQGPWSGRVATNITKCNAEYFQTGKHPVISCVTHVLSCATWLFIPKGTDVHRVWMSCF